MMRVHAEASTEEQKKNEERQSVSLLRLQEEASTSQKRKRPEDSARATSPAGQVKALHDENQRLEKNLEEVRGQLEEARTTLRTLQDQSVAICCLQASLTQVLANNEEFHSRLQFMWHQLWQQQSHYQQEIGKRDEQIGLLRQKVTNVTFLAETRNADLVRCRARLQLQQAHLSAPISIRSFQMPVGAPPGASAEAVAKIHKTILGDNIETPAGASPPAERREAAWEGADPASLALVLGHPDSLSVSASTPADRAATPRDDGFWSL